MQNVDAVAENNDILRKFSRELPVALNDHELQSYGKMLAEKVREEELAEEKKKQVVAEHTNRIKEIRIQIKRIADARAKGEELRPVQCAERIKGNVIEIVRMDRGEVVDTRPADLRDLQTTLPGTDLPEDFEAPEIDDDETPDVGGPNKTGRAVDSSVGDTVHVGGDVDDPEMNAEPGDFPPSEPNPDQESLPLAECASCGEVITGLQEYEVVGTGRMVHKAECLERYSANGSEKKPGRERSRKANEAKGTSKSNGKAKKKR